MKEHTYLDHAKKAGTLVLVLALCAAALLIVSCAVMGGAHSVLSTVLLGAGVLFALALACFLIHYLNHNNVQGQSIKAPMAVLHAWSVHGILMVAALLVGKVGSFSYGVTHALLDGCLAALLALLCYCFANRKPGFWLPALAAVAAAVLSLLEIHIAVELLLIVLAVIVIVIAVRGFRLRAGYAISTIITALVVIVIAVLALVKGSSVSMHMALHIAVELAMLFVAYAARFLVKTGSVRARENQPFKIGQDDKPEHRGADAVLPVRAMNKNSESDADKRNKSVPSADADQDEHFTSTWVNKRVEEGLSPSELLLAPVDSLYGVSAGDAELLKAAFGIRTIGDLADNKFFAWAQEIVEEANK